MVAYDLEMRVKELEEELVWCHAAMLKAHNMLNPEIPAPDWHTVYESLKVAESGKGSTLL